MNRCCDCERELDIEKDEYTWSSTKNHYLCWECREDDENSLSTINIANGDWVDKYLIGQHVRVDEEGNEIPGKYSITREWVPSDAHRGHYLTKIYGWETVLSGWTTGQWGDETTERKQVFNQWAQDIISCNEYPPVPIAIVFDLTSNLFSTRVSVLTKDVNAFNDWVKEEQYERLSRSLS